MRKIIFFMFCCAATPGAFAQKCLDINIVSLMGQLQPPASAASAYGNCQTTKNSDRQSVIVNYGTAYTNLDNMLKTNMQAFNGAAMAGMGATGPDPSQVQNAQALAAKMQSMTPDQQKAYAMQMAQNMQHSYTRSPAMAENPQIAKLVGQTQTIAATQLVPLDNEFAAKYRELIEKEVKEKAQVAQPNYAPCPGVDKIGLPSCGCINGIAGTYWGKIIAIDNRYIAQKNALLESYLPRIKALVGQIEDNIAKLHRGDDVSTQTYKRMLSSSQSTAFSAAFDTAAAIVEENQKTGSDDYVNKVNCDNQVYLLGCASGGK
ncbi:MAG: hypothetical protein JST19_19870 [Bacteroidetes bacterium]|nr:hypothetical protein [Bacteroidota bacterium]